MNLFLRCFGCKKFSKKDKKTSDSSNVKFRSFINQDANLQNKISLNLVKNSVIQNENKNQNIEQNKNQNNINNNNQEKNTDILIENEIKEEKNKITNEQLISEEEEKKENIKNILYSKFGLNLNKEIDFDEPLLKTDSPLICDFEKNIIFTKGNLIELFDKYWKIDKYKKIWDKDNLIIEINSEGTDINNKFNLIKVTYKQKKAEFNENCDIQTIIDFLYFPSLRLKWDKILKNFELIEGNIESNYIIRSLAKAPTFLMSERESLEKKFIFKNKDGNGMYIISSSIPDDLFETKKDVVRIFNYINYYKIVDEGDYIGFYSLNQTDFKMPIPQFLINVTLPTTTKNWQISLEQFAKEVKYDKETKNIISNNNEKNE